MYIHQVIDELVSGPLQKSVANEDNVNLEDACSVLYEVIKACLDLIRAVLGKIEDLEEDTVIPNLKNKLERTKTEIKSLKQQLEEMRGKNERRLEEERRKQECEHMKMRSDFDARFKHMEQKLTALTEKITCNERRHKDEVAVLNKKIETLTCNELTLMVGQLAFEVETEIIEKVLQNYANPRHNIHHLDEMLDAITGKATYNDIFHLNDDCDCYDDGDSTCICATNRKKAKEAWDHLKVKLGLKDQFLFPAMRAVKHLRRGLAHPPFVLQVVEDTVAKGIVREIESDCRKKFQCQELIKLYKELKSL